MSYFTIQFEFKINFLNTGDFSAKCGKTSFQVSLGGGPPKIITLNSEYWVHTAPNHFLAHIDCWHRTIALELRTTALEQRQASVPLGVSSPVLVHF
jgi:hypothetical protein